VSDSERRLMNLLRNQRFLLSMWRQELDNLSNRIDAQWTQLAQLERDEQLSMLDEELF
jgi:hypothetical protein